MSRAKNARAAFHYNYMTFDELLIEADNIAVISSQDFENEKTWFQYADGSIAIFDGKGQEIHVYKEG